MMGEGVAAEPLSLHRRLRRSCTLYYVALDGIAIVRAAGVALRRVLTACEEHVEDVARRTARGDRSLRRSLPSGRRVRQLADGSERAGDVRPLHPFGAVRRCVSPDRGARAGAGLRM